MESNSSEIIPIHKSGDTKKPENYRPIALINTIIKVYELTILNQIENRTELIADSQYGAVRGRSAPIQYEQLAATVGKRLKQQNDTWLLLVDFSKAFDNVNRRKLIGKLRRTGIPDHLINAIRM